MSCQIPGEETMRQGEEEGLEGRLHSRPHLRGRFAIISKAKYICQHATPSMPSKRLQAKRANAQTGKPPHICPARDWAGS